MWLAGGQYRYGVQSVWYDGGTVLCGGYLITRRFVRLSVGVSWSSSALSSALNE